MADPLRNAKGEGATMMRTGGPHGTDDVWSNVTLNGRRMKWRELYEAERAARIDSDRWKAMVLDLDRSPAGRHEGDSENQDPSGVSRGNPRFVAGDVIGWDISGRAYVFPPRAERWRFESWLALQI